MIKAFTGKLILAAAAALVPALVWAQENTDQSKFRQLGTELPTPNNYRTGSGAPGHEYWKQRADYKIAVTLNDKEHTLKGEETITYTNNSPDELKYIGLQLDQNIFKPDADSYLTKTGDVPETMSFYGANALVSKTQNLGYRILSVTTAGGKGLHYVINKTMMRVDLPAPLKSKGKFSFKVSWFNHINQTSIDGGRSGYEMFEDSNAVYEIAQWFPRMAVYDDYNGWQHKQFLGSGEFTLDFGDYDVSITVPADHVVGSTGELQNAGAVLTAAQKQRLKQAENAKQPVLIVSQDEAVAAEKTHKHGTKTWRYKAENVRDFAWASSRKFIWDAMRTNVMGKKIWAMSYYPKEGNPLWGKYSTKVVAHTLNVYSKYSIPYTYPVAISVHGPIYGMEYPMICFNGGRPEKDGTYSERLKYAMISVIIHEVGHNFFPMIVSSDERQWTWMDEGLNTFLQYLTEQEWQRNYPSGRGEPRDITAYMKGDKGGQVPIMTNSESVLQFGNNAYGKPATALNILRETVLGRELFDFAFREYSRRWAYKHPNPGDFFRSMEDASGTDLDWFWRGWFYTTDHVDISLKSVDMYNINTANPEVEKELARKKKEAQEQTASRMANKILITQTLADQDTSINDFYNRYDQYAVTKEDVEKYKDFVAALSEKERKLLGSSYNFYKLGFENVGGLVMPLVIQLKFEDGKDSLVRIPAEIWRYNNKEVFKVIVTEKPVKEINLDPYQETADTDLGNNSYPRKLTPSRFQIVKERANRQAAQPNPMQERNSKKKPN